MGAILITVVTIFLNIEYLISMSSHDSKPTTIYRRRKNFSIGLYICSFPSCYENVNILLQTNFEGVFLSHETIRMHQRTSKTPMWGIVSHDQWLNSKKHSNTSNSWISHRLYIVSHEVYSMKRCCRRHDKSKLKLSHMLI
jgi:hypothetical protein